MDRLRWVRGMRAAYRVGGSNERGAGKLGQLAAVAVHLPGLNQRENSTDDHREHTNFVESQNSDRLFAPLGEPLAAEEEHLEWIDAQEANHESRRGLHAAAMPGKVPASNASNSDRNQGDDCE